MVAHTDAAQKRMNEVSKQASEKNLGKKQTKNSDHRRNGKVTYPKQNMSYVLAQRRYCGPLDGSTTRALLAAAAVVVVVDRNYSGKIGRKQLEQAAAVAQTDTSPPELLQIM